MIRRIIEHNELNGVAFSVVEFMLVAAAATFIAIGFGLHHGWIGVLLAAGIVLNSLVVVGYGAAAWRRGERGYSLRYLRDARHREELSRKHPTMMRDTFTLTAAVIVPYWLLVAVVRDRSQGIN